MTGSTASLADRIRAELENPPPGGWPELPLEVVEQARWLVGPYALLPRPAAR